MAIPIEISEIFSWEDFDAAVEALAKSIETSDLPVLDIYGVPRGGLILAVALSHRLDLPMITDVCSVSLATLVVDDISDSGETLSGWFRNPTATIHIVPGTKMIPKHYFMIRKAQWVIYPWEKKI